MCQKQKSRSTHKGNYTDDSTHAVRQLTKHDHRLTVEEMAREDLNTLLIIHTTPL